MIDQQTFEKENRKRIKTVEKLFGPSGRSLYQPGRILMGEGCLRKQGRRKAETKVFFLFNDVLVYSSIIISGRWHKKQKIISLEDIQLEDMEDNDVQKNQWLMCTPRKSFFVCAPSHKEKRVWMDHIQECKANLLQGGSHQAGSNFAVSWIPDRSSYKCMRCLSKFSVRRRRHHCRKCGFLVCNSCSKQRQVIKHIHPSKRLRVCSLCHRRKEEDAPHARSDSVCNNSSEDEGRAPTSDEEEEVEEETWQNHAPSYWLDSRRGTWGQMNRHVKPKHVHMWPPTVTM